MNRGLFIVHLGVGVCVYRLITDDALGEAISCAFGEMIPLDHVSGEIVADGVWVGEFSLVDDGPSDWPGARETAVVARDLRPATIEEWTAYTREEHCWDVD